jgi:hypothetical protein
MADTRENWGNDLDEADHAEIKNVPWIKFAARAYQRACEDVADETVADYDADHKRVSLAEKWRALCAFEAAKARRDRLLDLGVEFYTFREIIDAEIEAEKLFRIAMLAYEARKFTKKFPLKPTPMQKLQSRRRQRQKVTPMQRIQSRQKRKGKTFALAEPYRKATS